MPTELARMPRLSGSAARLRPGVFSELQGKIDQAGREGRGLAPLHIGDTFLLPPSASRRASPEADPALYRYGPTAGLGELREAIACFVARERDLPWVREEHVLVGAGGTHALHCASRVLFDPGDEIVMLAPFWPLAPGIFEAQGARTVEVVASPLLYADPSLDLRSLLEGHVGPKTRAIYFVSPNNPDGKMLGPRHLEEVLAVAREHDLWVLADEVYADVTYGAPHLSFGTLPGARERSLLLYSFSKSFALAGQRVGFLVAPPPLVAAARRISTHTIFNVPVASQRAALAALEHGPAFVAEARARYKGTRDAVARILAESGVDYTLPEGAVYFFLDLSPRLGTRPLTDLLAHAIDHGVLLAPGDAFGQAFARHARLCFTSVPEEETLAGVRALVRALRSF